MAGAGVAICDEKNNLIFEDSKRLTDLVEPKLRYILSLPDDSVSYYLISKGKLLIALS